MAAGRLAFAFTVWLVFGSAVNGDTLTLQSDVSFNGRVNFDGRIFEVSSRFKFGTKVLKIPPDDVKKIEFNSTDFNPGGLSDTIEIYLGERPGHKPPAGVGTTPPFSPPPKPRIRVELILNAGGERRGVLSRIGRNVELAGEKHKYRRNEVRSLSLQ